MIQPSSYFCLIFLCPEGFQPPYRHGCTADLPHQSGQCQSEGWPSWPDRPRTLLQVGMLLVFLLYLQLGIRLCVFFFSLELFIILNFGGMWAVGRPEGLFWTQCFCREKDVLHFVPVPTFTCCWSALDAIRIRAKPKAFPRLCCKTREGLFLIMCCAAAQTPQCAGEATLWLDYECLPRVVLLGAELMGCAVLGWAGQRRASL